MLQFNSISLLCKNSLIISIERRTHTHTPKLFSSHLNQFDESAHAREKNCPDNANGCLFHVLNRHTIFQTIRMLWMDSKIMRATIWPHSTGCGPYTNYDKCQTFVRLKMDVLAGRIWMDAAFPNKWQQFHKRIAIFQHHSERMRKKSSL